MFEENFKINTRLLLEMLMVRTCIAVLLVPMVQKHIKNDIISTHCWATFHLGFLKYAVVIFKENYREL
jgi:hypothetical protein